MIEIKITLSNINYDDVFYVLRQRSSGIEWLKIVLGDIFLDRDTKEEKVVAALRGKPFGKQLEKLAQKNGIRLKVNNIEIHRR